MTTTQTIQRISLAAMFPRGISAISAAKYINENRIRFLMPKGFGYVFTTVTIIDDRYQRETISVHNLTIDLSLKAESEKEVFQ